MLGSFLLQSGWRFQDEKVEVSVMLSLTVCEARLLIFSPFPRSLYFSVVLQRSLVLVVEVTGDFTCDIVTGDLKVLSISILIVAGNLLKIVTPLSKMGSLCFGSLLGDCFGPLTFLLVI